MVLVLGLNCSVARGIFPGQRSDPCLLQGQADSSPLSHEGGPLHFHVKPQRRINIWFSRSNYMKFFWSRKTIYVSSPISHFSLLDSLEQRYQFIFKVPEVWISGFYLFLIH